MSTRRHTMYNLLGAAAPVLMMLATVPLYIHLVGEARYGVLALVWIFTGYFSFFDFGLGRATAYAMARAGDEPAEARARIFWTALVINAGFGLAGGLVVLAAAPPLFNEVFNLTPDLKAELAPALPWLALAIPLLTLEGVFSGALTGRERFLALNARSIAGTAITQFLPLAFVWSIAPTLAVAIPATILARTISVAILMVVAFRAVPAGPRPRFGGRQLARRLLGYGGWVSLGSFLDPIVANLDRFLIATYLNAVAVAHYTVPFQIVTRGGLFSRSLTNAIFPRLARVDPGEVRRLGLKAMRANAALMAVLCATGMAIMQPFLALWISPSFALAASAVGQQLAISVWLTSLALIPYNVLQARGRPRETVYVLLAQLAIFAPLAIAGLTWWGIVGVAVARNVRSLLNLFFLGWRAGFAGDIARISVVPLLVLPSIVVTTNYLGLPQDAQLATTGLQWCVAVIYALRTFPEGLAMVSGRLAHRFRSRACPSPPPPFPRSNLPMLNLAAKIRSGRQRLINQAGLNPDAVFIWIPKSAGTSIYGSLERLGCPKLKTEGRIRRVFPQRGLVTFVHLDYKALVETGLVSREFDARARKFAIVRDPYARAVSIYLYLRDRHRRFRHWHVEPGFEEFLEMVDRGFFEKIGIYNDLGWCQANPQVSWTRGIELDFVGKVENMEESLAGISQLLGKPLSQAQWLNKGSGADEAGGLLDTGTRRLIDRIYDEDFETFGYPRHG